MTEGRRDYTRPVTGSWVLIACVGLASAGPMGVEQDPDFVEAVGLYNDLEFEQSIFRLQDVALNDALSDDERALVFVWMGINYGQLGDLRAADRAFEQGLRRDPDILLPTPVPPSVEQRFARARSRVQEDEADADRPAPPPPIEPTPAPVKQDAGAPRTQAPVPPNVAAVATGVGATGALAVGLACAAVAAYALVGAFAQYQLAQSKQRTQRDAQDRIAWANAAGLVAAGAGVVGVSALVGSGTLVGVTVWLSGME